MIFILIRSYRFIYYILLTGFHICICVFFFMEITVLSNSDILQNEDIYSLSEVVKDEAVRFCIEHEQEKDLFALCQVANNLYPTHNHFRKLYTDYNKCNYDVRKAIMILNDIPLKV